uniref:Uncharacterized protein n=1 Tax=Anguilla anguilla TaxID=7936 RepID=A0A0E9Q102_ANGAN
MRLTYVMKVTMKMMLQMQKLPGQSAGRGLSLKLYRGQMMAALMYSSTITKSM